MATQIYLFPYRLFVDNIRREDHQTNGLRWKTGDDIVIKVCVG